MTGRKVLHANAGRGMGAQRGDARIAIGRGSDVEDMRRAATRALLVSSIARIWKVNQMSEKLVKEMPQYIFTE